MSVILVIEVSIWMNDEDSTEIGYLKVERIQIHDDGTADYIASFSVDRAKGAIGMHRRPILRFPRTKYNSLALLLQALNTLAPEELELESGTGPSDLERRQRRARRSLRSQA